LRPQDGVRGTRHFAGRVDVLDAYEPFAAGLARVQKARHRSDDRA